MDSRWLPKGYKSNCHPHKFTSLWIGAHTSLMRAQHQVLEVGPTHHVMSEHSLLGCLPLMAYSKYRERRDRSGGQCLELRRGEWQNLKALGLLWRNGQLASGWIPRLENSLQGQWKCIHSGLSGIGNVCSIWLYQTVLVCLQHTLSLTNFLYLQKKILSLRLSL